MRGEKILYHSSNSTELHTGICLTDEHSAADYGRLNYGVETGIEVELDTSGMTVAHVEAPSHENGDYNAPGDDGDNRGADILVYDDLTPAGRTGTTWRLMTPAAVAAAVVLCTYDIND